MRESQPLTFSNVHKGQQEYASRIQSSPREHDSKLRQSKNAPPITSITSSLNRLSTTKLPTSSCQLMRSSRFSIANPDLDAAQRERRQKKKEMESIRNSEIALRINNMSRESFHLFMKSPEGLTEPKLNVKISMANPLVRSNCGDLQARGRSKTGTYSRSNSTATNDTSIPIREEDIENLFTLESFGRLEDVAVKNSDEITAGTSPMSVQSSSNCTKDSPHSTQIETVKISLNQTGTQCKEIVDYQDCDDNYVDDEDKFSETESPVILFNQSNPTSRSNLSFNRFLWRSGSDSIHNSRQSYATVSSSRSTMIAIYNSRFTSQIDEIPPLKPALPAPRMKAIQPKKQLSGQSPRLELLELKSQPTTARSYTHRTEDSGKGQWIDSNSNMQDNGDTCGRCFTFTWHWK